MKLSTTLYIYALCVCGCILAAISIMFEGYMGRDDEEQAIRQTRLMQHHVTERIGDFMDEVGHDVRHLAGEFELLGALTVERQARKALELTISDNRMIMAGAVALVPDSLGRRVPEWMLYVVSAPDGDFKVSQLGGTDYNYTNQSWYKTPLLSGKPAWSSPYIDRGGGECLMTTYSVPVTDRKGQIRAIVTADVSLQKLTEEVQELRPYPESVSYLALPSGEAVRVPGIELPSFSGMKVITGKSRIAALGLDIITVTPLDTVLASVERLKLPLLAIVFAGLVSLIVGLHIVISRTTRPLRRLADAAKEIGGGNFSVDIPDCGRYSDIARMGAAMSAMKESIAGYVEHVARTAREQARIAGELDIARGIQIGMLPSVWSPKSGAITGKIDVEALFHPAREVSGDMYDYMERDGKLHFIIADVSDKGMPASLFMAAVHSLYRFAVESGMTPAEIVDRINHHLCADNPNNMFVTMIAGTLDPSSGNMALVNAGHTSPVLIDGKGVRSLHLPPGLPVGVMEDMRYSATRVAMTPGSVILFFTDGLSEAEDSEGKQYGDDNLISCLESMRREAYAVGPRDVLGRITSDMKSRGMVPNDDLTILCIALTEPQEIELRIGYDITEISRMAVETERFAELRGWDADVRQKTALILEEAVSNVINHSIAPEKDSVITVKISDQPDTVLISLLDSGPKFDPCSESPEVDTGLDVELRPVGGLGLLLIKRLAARMEYERTVSGENHLVITIDKTIATI